MFILGGFGLVVGDELNDKLAADPGFQQSDSALLGVRICITFAPILFTLISLFLLHKFQMNKSEHSLIRAAVATKHKYGSVALTEEQIKIVEKISGQKYENTWLGKDNDSAEAYTVEANENGEYDILVEIEEEMKKIRNSKEEKTAIKENA